MPHFFPSTLSRPAGFLAALGLGLATAGAVRAQAPTPASFGPITIYSVFPNTYPNDVAVADVNGDGWPDIVTSNAGSHTAGVLPGRAGGGFGPVASYSTGIAGMPTGMVVADMDRDGRPDLVTVNTNINAVAVLRQAAGGFAPVSLYFCNTNGPTGLAVADLNADGRPDVVTANYLGNTVGVLLAQASGGLAPPTFYATGANSQPVGVAIGDVNADGRPDVVTANYLGNTVGVLLAQASGGFGPASSYSAGVNSLPEAVVIVDVNGDGRADLVTANSGDDVAGVLLGQATGGFAPVASYSCGANTGPRRVAVADVNGDGRPDIVTANINVGSIGVLLARAGGGFAPVVLYSPGAFRIPQAVALADVNGDGRPDIITANQNGDTVGVLLNTGTFTPLAAMPGAPAADVTLFPNPARGSFAVQLPAAWGTAPVRAELLNALDQVVATRATQTIAGAPLTVETAGLSAGTYTLRLDAGGRTLTKRVVVE
jgi:hypothetical protein